MGNVSLGLPDFNASLGIPDFSFGPKATLIADGSEIFGQPNDMRTHEGQMFANLWGHRASDQRDRANAWTHLTAIPAGDRTYNLQNQADFRDFLADLEDGKLDGKAEHNGFQGVTFSQGGKVLVGDKAYDITTPQGLQSLLRDSADGKIDGNIGQRPEDGVDGSRPSSHQNDPFQPMPVTQGRRPAAAQPVEDHPVRGDRCGHGGRPAPATPVTPTHPASGSHKANVVDYDGESYDLNTEEGRDALKARLAEEGIDYDTATNQVRCGDETYDLDTEKGRRGFMKDAEDGLMDGQWGDDPSNIVYDGRSFDTTTEEGRRALEEAMEGYGVDYNRATNVVTVNGKHYDLDTEKGRRAFREDMKDGVLDGKASGAHQSRPPRPETTPPQPVRRIYPVETTGGSETHRTPRPMDRWTEMARGMVAPAGNRGGSWRQPSASDGRPTTAHVSPRAPEAAPISMKQWAEGTARGSMSTQVESGGSWRQHAYRA